MSMLSVSSGGGVQSTAMLALAALDRIPHRLFLFANVGDRAENPETLRYYAEHAKPFAEAHGIELVELRWVSRGGKERDLYDDLVASDKDIPIPVRLGSGDFANRKCTARYKIEVVARELRKRGATIDEPAEVAIGISTDEIQRARPGVPHQQPWTTNTYPLIDLGLSRKDCLAMVASVGLPPPPKSSCWFCPYQGVPQWQKRRQDQPDLFDRAVKVEVTLNRRRAEMGRDRIGLLSATMPLDEVLDYQPSLMAVGDDCDSGWCFT